MNLTRYLKNIDSLIAALIGFYTIHLFTKYSGVGLSPDSIMYASTATNIQAHGSLLTFNKTPLVFFPVFYPFFLGLIQFISRIDPVAAGAMINASLFGAVIFTSGWIISNFGTRSIIYKWLILAGIILSPGLLEIYTYLWSETLFILEVLVFFIAYRYYQQSHNLKALLTVAFVSAVACITRYAGVTVIGTGGLMLLLDTQLPVKKKISHTLIYGFLSVSLLIGNLILNIISTGLSTGTREPSVTSFTKNLYYIGTVLADWGSLSKEAYPYAVLIASVVLIAIIAILSWKSVKGRTYGYENVITAFAIVYGLFIVISATISRYETINNRLLAPMFIPLLLACTSWGPDVLKHVRSNLKYLLAGVAILMMLTFEYVTYQTDWQRYDDENDYGVPGYSDDDWNKSEFVVYLKRNKGMFKPEIPIYTDADEAVYLFTGMSSTLIPHKFFKRKVQSFLVQKRFYLIWFDNLYNPELISLPDIMKHKKLIKLGGVKEGEIYYCNEK